MARQSPGNVALVISGDSSEAVDAINAVSSATMQVPPALGQANAASDKLARSTVGLISYTKDLELRIRAEAAAGDDLQSELVQLDRQYETLAASMRAMARAGQEIPQSLVQQAAAASRARDEIRKGIQAQEEARKSAETLNKTFEKFTVTGIAAASWAAAAKYAALGFGLLKQKIVETAPSLADLNREWTSGEKSMASIRDTINDPAFEKLPTLVQAAVVAYRALNTELAEEEARFDRFMAQSREHERDNAARMEAATYGNDSTVGAAASENAIRLARMNAEAAARASAVWRKHFEERSALYRADVAEHQSAIAASQEAEQASLDARTDAYRRRLEEQAKAYAEWQERQKAYNKSLEDYASSRIDERRAREFELLQRTAAWEEQRRQAAVQAASATANAWGTAFSSIASGEQTMSQAVIKAAFATMRIMVTTAMAEAAAKQVAWAARLGPVGIAVGTAAAASTLAVIEGLVSKAMGKYATGGVVSGGIPGVDSVPILAQQGERVLTTRQTEAFERLVASLERSGGMAGGGNVNISVRGAITTSADGKRAAREAARVMRSMQTRGR